MFHGVTDAPAVDVRVAGNNLVSALEYGKSSTFLSVPAADYVVDVAPAGGAVLKSYNVPGIAIKGQSAIVFASGFLNPAANLNGSAFGLFALVGTNVVELSEAVTSVLEVSELPGASVTPNPASADVTARFVMPTEGVVSIRIYDLAGALITESQLQNVSSGVHAIPVALNSVSAGGYVMVIDAGIYRSALPFAVTR